MVPKRSVGDTVLAWESVAERQHLPFLFLCVLLRKKIRKATGTIYRRHVSDRPLNGLSCEFRPVRQVSVGVLILLRRPKSLERLNNLPRVMALIRGRARVPCMLGLASKSVFLTIRLCCLCIKLYSAVVPKFICRRNSLG